VFTEDTNSNFELKPNSKSKFSNPNLKNRNKTGIKTEI